LEDDSRKDAKHAKYKQDYKFETRNPKFETISNGQKLEKVSSDEWQVTRNFPSTPDPRPSFLSDFDIRISDFVSLASLRPCSGHAWRDNIFCRFNRSTKRYR